MKQWIGTCIIGMIMIITYLGLTALERRFWAWKEPDFHYWEIRAVKVKVSPIKLESEWEIIDFDPKTFTAVVARKVEEK